ncbi:MAG: extracellular solute-binding protein [Planctomycetota bacterium]
MNHRKARFGRCLALLLVLLFGSCEQRDDTVELELWTYALRPTFNDYMAELVADFEADHPGVEVVWVDVPWGLMRRKMFAAGAAGALPDVVNLSDADFAVFANLGALHELEGRPGGFVPGALDACVIDGRLMGLPWYLSTPVRVVNADLLERGGLSVETVGDDWATLMEQAEPFHSATGKFLFTLRLGEDSELPALMIADGLTPIMPHEEGGWRSNLTDPAVVAYAQRWVDLFKAGALPRSAATGGYGETVQAYTDQAVAVLNANALRKIEQTDPALFENTVVLPGLRSKAGGDPLAVMHLAVGRQSDHPELAEALALHVASPEWQTELAIRASRLPSTVASLDDPAFTDQSTKITAATALSAAGLMNARSYNPPVGPWPDMRRAFNDGIKRVLLEDTDLAAVLAEVDAEWNRMLRADAEGMSYK